jgi:hypothetical protein
MHVEGTALAIILPPCFIPDKRIPHVRGELFHLLEEVFKQLVFLLGEVNWSVFNTLRSRRD